MNYTVYRPHPDLLAAPEPERIEWAEALESGEYGQGKGYLFRDGGYCCLGVLAIINGIPKCQIEGRLDLPDYFTLGGQYLNQIYAARNETDEPFSFPTLNDSLGLTFPQIARLLRGYPVAIEHEGV